LLGPSFMDGRASRRPGHAFRLNPNSGPVCPVCDIGVALFGGLLCICEWPFSASTPPRQSSAPICSLDFRANRLRGDAVNPADYARMAEECSRQADAMRPGTERDALMEKARLYRSYARMDNWVASRELQPPS